MKLLVGGDSFAQFPDHSFQCIETRPYIDYPESNLGKGFRQNLLFKHWCQHLDEDAVSVGIGGADISTTSFVTLQELMSGNYTHCIFFVTNFYRDIVEINKADPMDSPRFADHTEFDTLYKDKDYIKHMHWTSENEDDADDMSEKVYRKIRTSVWFDTDEIIGKHKQGFQTYLKYYADFKYIHNRLSNLMFLKKYCDDNGINLCFVYPFYPDPSSRNTMKYISGEHFHYPIKQTTITSEFFKWAVTHHTEDEHLLIAHRFKRRYSYWLNK